MIQDDYKVELEVFEGPLDLLLYLIRKEEVDIYNIPIEKITTQYMEYLSLMRMLDLNIAGEFIVMAATLMLLESHADTERGVRRLFAAYCAVRETALDVLDAVVAAGPLEIVCQSYKDFCESWRWHSALESTKFLKRITGALVSAAVRFPASSGLAPIVSGLLALAARAPCAFDAVCVRELAAHASPKDIEKCLSKSFEVAPSANYLAFFETYGAYLGFHPAAKAAPPARFISQLIGVGAERVFELLPPHTCNTGSLSVAAKGSPQFWPLLLYSSQEIPLDAVWRAFEKFYQSSVCVEFPKLVSVVVGAILSRSYDSAAVLDVLERIARICPVESWQTADILQYLIPKSGKYAALFCRHFVPASADLIRFLHSSVEFANAECFAVLAGKIAMTPALASEFLVFAHLKESTPIAAVCRGYVAFL